MLHLTRHFRKGGGRVTQRARVTIGCRLRFEGKAAATRPDCTQKGKAGRLGQSAQVGHDPGDKKGGRRLKGWFGGKKQRGGPGQQYGKKKKSSDEFGIPYGASVCGKEAKKN